MTTVTFKVAPVEHGNVDELKVLTMRDYADMIGDHWHKKNAASMLSFEVGQVNHNRLVQGECRNGLLSTIMIAYNHHLPLMLAPDDFWLAIALSVAQFLGDEKNAEKYRSIFVQHEGIKELIVRGEPFNLRPKSPGTNKAGWPMFVDAIVALIDANTNGEIKDIMTSGFSTTGKIESTAVRIAFMESMKHYFSYTCKTRCGIPELTLSGVETDYVRILEKIEQLEKLLPDFSWYLKRMRVIMQKVLDSYRGKADVEWWQKMFSEKYGGSGEVTKLTGWIGQVFAFNGDGTSNMVDKPPIGSFNQPLVTYTPVKFDDNGNIYQMKFVGGFIGTAIDERNDDSVRVVRPAIGWMTFYVDEKKA